MTNPQFYYLIQLYHKRTKRENPMTIDYLTQKVLENNPEADIELLRLAYDFAEEAHREKFRKNGDPYIEHCLHTAFVLAQIKADFNTVLAGLLHEIPEESEHKIEEIEKNFGTEVASLIEGVAKLSKLKYRGIERYKEDLRKMFLSIARDLRVILIKFSDRLHNLRTLDSLPPDKQQRIAKETLEIYTPIAGLLGIERLKWQMEDMSFKYLYPEEYIKIEYKYEVERKVERQRYIQKVKNRLKQILNQEGINYKISGRMKHLYSIYKKMMNKDREFDEIHDVFALRIVTDSISDCYRILGIIHDIWKPKPGHFKDYISAPKPNGYRSLHTKVLGPEGKITEFQIRTKEMDDEAKFGIAAHWHYKIKDQGEKKQPQWVKEILEMQKDIENSDEFINKIKLDVFKNRIFVFSPKGDVFELPEGSTPIDFAYAVHTDIGNKASVAIVNEKISSMDHELKNGDLVEIKTEKNRQGPNPAWIKFVKTKRAKEKIKQNSNKSGFGGLKKFIPRI